MSKKELVICDKCQESVATADFIYFGYQAGLAPVEDVCLSCVYKFIYSIPGWQEKLKAFCMEAVPDADS